MQVEVGKSSRKVGFSDLIYENVMTYKYFQAFIRIQYTFRFRQIPRQQCIAITALFHGVYVHMSIAQERSDISILPSVL